jgi:hypothetical protein
LAKDRTPDARGKSGAARGGTSPAGKAASGARPASGTKAAAAKNRGRIRPPTQVVTQPRRPWGLIAASIAVVLFAVAAIGYAVVQANRSEAEEITSPDEIKGVQTYEYEAGTHTADPVDYAESPPVGGAHAGVPEWADCTGTVYDVDIRHENAVHSLEHGAVWITYNPDEVSDAGIATLSKLVDGESGRMLSPYEGQDTPVSVQSWNHQLKVQSVDDPRIKQYADFFTYNADYYPEPGASCENPTFLADPPLEADDGPATVDGAGTPAPSSDAPEPSASAGASESATQ